MDPRFKCNKTGKFAVLDGDKEQKSEKDNDISVISTLFDQYRSCVDIYSAIFRSCRFPQRPGKERKCDKNSV